MCFRWRTIYLYVFALAGFAILAPCSFAQTWSFTGTQACYHSHMPNAPAGLPDLVQCFGQGTLLSLTSQPAVDQSYQQYRSYEAGKQLGAGAGALMVVLVKAWEAHHQQVEIEGADMRKQIDAYLRANLALFDEDIAMLNQDVESERQLEKFDPDRRDKLVEIEKGRLDLIAKMVEQRENVRAYECKSVTGKQPRRDLHYALTAQGGVQWIYNSLREQLLKEWVVNRSLALVLSTHEGKEIADPPRTTAAYDNVCSQ
jgi:hypothetical protein